jgi:hypothetical protein
LRRRQEPSDKKTEEHAFVAEDNLSQHRVRFCWYRLWLVVLLLTKEKKRGEKREGRKKCDRGWERNENFSPHPCHIRISRNFEGRRHLCTRLHITYIGIYLQISHID